VQDIEDIKERIKQLKKQVHILEEATNMYTHMYKVCVLYCLLGNKMTTRLANFDASQANFDASQFV
jgi:hypothetical protein